jgi:hypothetical protein
MRAAVLGVAATLLLLLFLFVVRPQKPPASPRCKLLRELAVWSHCGEGLDARTGFTSHVTERSVRRLHDLGVNGFDFDVFWSTDGEQFVGHPGKLRPEHGDVFTLSSKALRADAADILSVSSLLKLTRVLSLRVAFDLKGRERGTYEQQLQSLHAQLLSHRLQGRTLLWLPTAAHARNLSSFRAASFPFARHVPFVLPLRDTGAPVIGGQASCASQLPPTDEERRLFTSLGPSRACANRHLFSAAGAIDLLRAPQAPGHKHHPAAPSLAASLLVWVVDDAAALDALLNASLGAPAPLRVISNAPLRVQRAATEMRRRQCGMAGSAEGARGSIERVARARPLAG